MAEGRCHHRVASQVSAADAAGFVETVQDDHIFPPMSRRGMDDRNSGTALTWTRVYSNASAPLFLHESTAIALGLHGGPVPDLVSNVLGRDALAVHRKRIRALLTQPPAPETADAIATAVRCAIQNSYM